MYEKKSLCIIVVIISLVSLFGLMMAKKILPSNSDKWNDEECQSILTNYSSRFPCDFETATNDIEKKIYGVWQVKEFVGYDNSVRYQWDGYNGDIIIFCQNAWIDNGIPEFAPVYFCFATNMSELSSEDFLDVTWTDSRYENKEGILTIAICSEKNEKFGSAVDVEPMQFIICDDVLIMEKNGSYFELEKVGEIQMFENFL